MLLFSCRAKPTSSPSSAQATGSASWAASWVWKSGRATGSSAAEKRKGIEAEITSLDGRLEEINTELGEEAARKARLKELRSELERLSSCTGCPGSGAGTGAQRSLPSSKNSASW